MLFDVVERVSKILSLAAIPLAVALGGWWIQERLATQTVSRDYVQLAVSILKEPVDKQDKELRAWAVGLVNAYSPVKLSARVVEGLETGNLAFPAGLLPGEGGRAFALSANGNRLLIATGSSVAMWDLQSGKELAVLRGHSRDVVGVALSPDGGMAATSSLDQTTRIWDVPSGRELSRLQWGGRVSGLGFSPDAKAINVITAQRDEIAIRQYDIASGIPLHAFSLRLRGEQ